MIGKGSPQGKVKAQIDQLYLDAGHAVLWVKESGSGKPTGWKCLGIVVPTGDDSYRTSQSTRPRLEGCPH
jgi:hypothetical protein